MPSKAKPRRQRPARKQKAKRLWYRRKNGEPLLTRAHKILVFIIAAAAVFGLGWNAISKADARYAKEIQNSQIHKELQKDVAMLGKSFEYDQLDRQAENKQDMIFKIEDRLRQRISPEERFKLEEIKKRMELEIEKVREKQKNLENQKLPQ